LYRVPGAGQDDGVEPRREVARGQDVRNQRSKARSPGFPARTATTTSSFACGLYIRGVKIHSKTPFSQP